MKIDTQNKVVKEAIRLMAIIIAHAQEEGRGFEFVGEPFTEMEQELITILQAKIYLDENRSK
jgi:hypothetical protein